MSKTILFYNGFFGAAPGLVGVPPDVKSMFSIDRADFDRANAVVFHVPDFVRGTPSIGDFMTLEKRPGQTWIAWSMESAVNYPVLDEPSLRAKIDVFMTYRRDAEIWAPYLPGRSEWKRGMQGAATVKRASAPLVMFQSARANKSGRIEFAKRLMRHVRVDSYGKVLRNRHLPNLDLGTLTKLATIRTYKFYLALENAIEDDYVTEKFFEPLLVGTVPVYRGAPNVAEFAPGERCYIDANAFRDERELGEYLRYLDRNDAAYATFLAWRQRPLLWRFERLLDRSAVAVFERLAQAIEARGQTRQDPEIVPALNIAPQA